MLDIYHTRLLLLLLLLLLAKSERKWEKKTIINGHP
jgi:hypothetical protein